MHVVTPVVARLLIRSLDHTEDLAQAHLHVVLALTGAGLSQSTAARVASATIMLIQNALTNGGGQLTVNLITDPEEPRLEVVVTDQGPGIDNIAVQLPAERYGAGLQTATEIFDDLAVCNRPTGGVQAVGRVNLTDETIARIPSVLTQTEVPDAAATQSGHIGTSVNLLATIRSLRAQAALLKEERDRLAREKTEAELLARARSSFLATMSHEIRTPLNAIVGLCGILRSDLMLDHQITSFELIHSSSEHLLSVINNILDYSKIEAGKVQLECAPFVLRHCIEEAFDVAIQRTPGKRIKCAYWLPNHIPERFNGDMARLRQVLVNLLSNASKFTSDGGEIVISVSGDSPSSNAWPIEISVSDSGIGIPQDRLHKLFKAFEQTDDSVYRKFGGTGLGLAITLGLVEAMGGSLSVDSAAGEGSTFRIRLGLTAASPAERPVGKAATLYQAMRGKHADLHMASSAVRRNVENHLLAFGVEYTPNGHRRVPDVIIAEREKLGLVVDQYRSESLQHRPPVILLGDERGESRISDIGITPAGVLQTPVKRGALFSLLVSTLQLMEPAEDRRSRSRTPDDQIAKKHPLDILLVEDNSVNQQVTKLMLQRLGYQPGIANDGAEAVRQVEVMHYDVILMDMHMPKLNGLDATQAIRKLSKLERQPIVIATTADISNDAREALLASGCNATLTKPFRLSDLVRALIRADAELHAEDRREAAAPGKARTP